MQLIFLSLLGVPYYTSDYTKGVGRKVLIVLGNIGKESELYYTR